MADTTDAAPERLETGVAQLDRVLGGGLLRGSLAMVIGAPGSGKTVMAQQMAFHCAGQGKATLFLTGYSESHEKLLSHGRGLSFFEPDVIGGKVQFVSVLDMLREGADETEDAIVATARSQEAALVIIDGFAGMRRLLPDGQAVAQFLYSLGAKLSLLGLTILITVEGDPAESARYPEITVCDTIVALRRELIDSRERQLLQVMKARGSSPLRGLHPYTITRDGVSVFPRYESTVGTTEPIWTSGRAAFAIEGIDALLGGGLNNATVTLAVGSPGVGKTLLGLHFALEGVRVGEPVLFCGFMESAAQLREQARAFGLDVEAAEAAGQLRLLVLPGYDTEADEIAGFIVEDVERRGVRRLVIDSAAELDRAIGDVSRKAGFLSAFVSYLRERHVTTYFTLDIPTIVGPALELLDTPLSIIGENLILMRKVEYRSTLHRVLSVLKMRFSDHDQAIYEYGITADEGIHVMGSAPLGEGLLTGIVRPLVDISHQSPSA